jgi:hypothetical protein
MWHASAAPQNTPKMQNLRTAYLNNHAMEFSENGILELHLHNKEYYRISKV